MEITVANLLCIVVMDDFKTGMLVYVLRLVWSDEHCYVIALLYLYILYMYMYIAVHVNITCNVMTYQCYTVELLVYIVHAHYIL